MTAYEAYGILIDLLNEKSNSAQREMEDAFNRNDALSASLWAFDIALIRELRTEYFDRIAQAHLS